MCAGVGDERDPNEANDLAGLLVDVVFGREKAPLAGLDLLGADVAPVEDEPRLAVAELEPRVARRLARVAVLVGGAPVLDVDEQRVAALLVERRDLFRRTVRPDVHAVVRGVLPRVPKLHLRRRLARGEGENAHRREQDRLHAASGCLSSSSLGDGGARAFGFGADPSSCAGAGGAAGVVSMTGMRARVQISRASTRRLYGARARLADSIAFDAAEIAVASAVKSPGGLVSHATDRRAPPPKSLFTTGRSAWSFSVAARLSPSPWIRSLRIVAWMSALANPAPPVIVTICPARKIMNSLSQASIVCWKTW